MLFRYYLLRAALDRRRDLTFPHDASSPLQQGDAPFLAYIAPHASHMPATPAPWYANAAVPGGGAPRTPAFNAPGTGKHWVLSELEELSPSMIEGVDMIYTQRLRSVLSVDDIIAEVVALLTEAGQINNTYFFFTSDHGYNLGVRAQQTSPLPPSRSLQSLRHKFPPPFLDVPPVCREVSPP